MIADTDAGLFIPQPERIFEFDKQAVHIYQGVVELHRSGFDLRKVEHIADKLQQECVVVFNDVDIFLFLFRNPLSADTSSEEKPTMALRGVRISWLMLARKEDLSVFASSAFTFAVRALPPFPFVG